jgi:predicted RNA-binding protein YlqC (UPF0109 family)
MRQEGRRPPSRREGHGRPFGGRDRGYGGSSGPIVDYRALVEFVAKSVAEDPASVEVQVFERPRGGLALKVKMAEADVGKLIGKRGRNIEALRTLVRTAALRERRRVFVDLA